MDETHCIDYRDTGYFSNLICDYLDQKPQLQKYYNRFPTLQNFEAQIAERQSFSEKQRQILVEALLNQYKDCSISEPSLQHIKSLKDKNTFTIVTGHQLNIFTGPLYFIYKIISAINLCKELKKAYPKFNFVPVYWMASEDHDFDEISFMHYKGAKLSWKRADGGPVGRFNTSGLEDVIQQLSDSMGPGTHARNFINLLKESYLNADNLAAATRNLVNALFGADGLVIVDGDDSSLKATMSPYFKKELFYEASYAAVSQTSQELQHTYFSQVHAREINLFYIKDGIRERIVKNGNRWEVLNTVFTFDKAQLEAELESYPERFSPNVILRPLYQEVILPNLAYIGGGGELAYWFQLKKMFAEFEVPFPMLQLRNSALWVDAKSKKHMAKLELNPKDLFTPIEQAKADYVKGRAPMDTELEPYEVKLQNMFNDLEEVAQLTDKSMLGAVNAQRQKQLNGLENLKKKLIRAEKKRQDISMRRFDKIYGTLFPNGSLQERYCNLSEIYEEEGSLFIEKLKKELQPLNFSFAVLVATP